MVRFEGVLSDKCAVYRIKSSLLGAIIVEVVCVFIVAPLLIIFSVLYDYGIVGSIVLSILLALSLIYFVVKYRTIKKPRANVNIELIADHGFIEYTVGLDNKEKIPTNSIKKVIKIGQCYYIIRIHHTKAWKCIYVSYGGSVIDKRRHDRRIRGIICR